MKTPETIDWLEVISATDARRARMTIRIHAVDTGGQTCCAIRIDERWLVGQARTMMFDSAAAAERFLDMVGVDGTHAGPERIDVTCRKVRHCFHLSQRGGLGTCPKRQEIGYLRPQQEQAVAA